MLLSTGDPGSRRSAALSLLAECLGRLPDIQVVAINHPQSNDADFDREMGDIFDVALHQNNLREATHRLPVLFIDGA